MLLCDENGEVIASSCWQLFNCLDPMEAEAKACEEGLKLALANSYKPIMVESYCSQLVLTSNTSPKTGQVRLSF
jgi:hypothetical protein